MSGAGEEWIIQTDIEKVRKSAQQRQVAAKKKDASSSLGTTNGRHQNKAGVQIQDAAVAEGELSRTIHQDDFLQNMTIAGQFNLAFIIARRCARRQRASNDDSDTMQEDDGEAPVGDGHVDDDLFIVDQHAADEKYNFEELQRETIIRSQPLIR